MTAQMQDQFQLRGHTYCVAGISEGELFDPALIELAPVAASTACWRGYQAVFKISSLRLVLDTLHTRLTEADAPRVQGPVINGIAPREQRGRLDGFDNHYFGLGYVLEYTGGLLLADDFIKELYLHMGFHPAWKYRRVVELIFHRGLLIREHDRSAEISRLRDEIITSGTDPRAGPLVPETREKIDELVRRAFDRSY